MRALLRALRARRARRTPWEAWGAARDALGRAVADADPARGVEVEVPPWNPPR